MAKKTHLGLRGGLLMALVIVGLLGITAVTWTAISLFGTGCDPVLDPMLCTAQELDAWKQAAAERQR